MKRNRLGPWLALALGAAYFLIPLIATLEFSLRIRRGAYSLDAYANVLVDPHFQHTFLFSTVAAVATIVVGTHPGGADRLLDPAAAAAACGPTSNSSRCCRW